MDEANVLKISLHGRLVGYLLGYQGGRNVLVFDDAFRMDPNRPTFSLITHPRFPAARKLMEQPWTKHQRLHPVLSNLLPEGALRELLAQGLKTHVDNEFQLFSHLGQDLPGALLATPMLPEEVPNHMLATQGITRAVKFNSESANHKFSLAGVQMKFSMKEQDGRYHVSPDELGDWIVKTPSTRHRDVPLNEYSAMSLAQLAGVEIPEIRLVKVSELDKMPPIKMADEKYAFAIRRFDRDAGRRVHMEDFAQILVKYPHEKYDSASYEQIARIIYEYSGDGLADAQQMARRLLVNILLANGDAHLKNWSMLYGDTVTPRLSPAYDIVTTSVYIEGETQYALNLGKTRQWNAVALLNFQAWAEKSGFPWRAIKPHLDDTIHKARCLWPHALNELPMNEAHKSALRQHWQNLQTEFRLLAIKN